MNVGFQPNELTKLLEEFGPIQSACVLTALESITDYHIKNPESGFIPGVLGYSAIAIIFKILLRNNELGKTNILWNSMTNLTDLYIGSVYYGESLTGNQTAGIVLIMTGMGLLYFSK
jgi:multidrug transporter EmrE-like cation transporter